MSELARIGVALDKDLLEKFDKLIGKRAYTNRSEAFRDLIRNELIQDVWKTSDAEMDVDHTFRAGHRIMVQVQSSWFPPTDRNPQKFMDIPNALGTDFVKAMQHVYYGGADGSRIQFRVER